MKEKIIVSVIAIIVTVGAIFTAIMIKRKENNINQLDTQVKTSRIEITDECTEEYEINQQHGIEQASASEDKVSANSALILKKYYKDCKHTINEYTEMLPELVNMTEDEVSEEFTGWELIGFSSNEVTLFKEFEGVCGEHFRLRPEGGKIVIYKVNENGQEEVFEKTEISTEYLTQTDLLQIQSENGIEVHGKEELNKVIEDFE